MKSISPIIATILIIVMTVAIAGIFYAFISGMFGSLTSSSNNLVNQQSQVTSFTINTIYCSNNILYFNIYNNGNIPININNSQIIFTDNNDNTIAINGSNIICNNGNIIPSGSNRLCYIINNYFCYYSYTDYIKNTNFVYNGVSYSYNIPNNNNFNLIYLPNSSSYQVTLYNTQSISTPEPFQQDIAICNGSINIGNNFAYVNNATLFNQINPNGQNVLFFNPNNNQLFYYSWYEGQENFNGVYCDVWWVNIPNGISANSNITIYMYIGNSSANYYPLIYPYVGTNEQVMGTMQYDNGQDVFIAYGYFNNTFDGWNGYIYQGSFSPIATPNGIEMLNNTGSCMGTYILPPNNGNIPEIPLIVEEAWYYTKGADANAISLFGNTNQQFNAYGIASPIISINGCGGTNVTGGSYNTCGGGTPASNLSTYVQFEYWSGVNIPSGQAAMLKSAVTYQYLNYTYFPTSGGTIYSYMFINSSYAQTGYYYYSSNQVWVPLTLLNVYTLSYNSNYGNYTYYNLNYNPFQYSTLEIGAGQCSPSYQYEEWVVARAYPPNGVMPSIYIG